MIPCHQSSEDSMGNWERTSKDTQKKGPLRDFCVQFKPPNFCSQVLCEMVFDDGFWFQRTASFVPPPVCKDVIYESMNGDGPCLAILKKCFGELQGC